MLNKIRGTLHLETVFELIDCTNAWRFLEVGDLEAYDMEIFKIVKESSPELEAIYLAQASMDGVEDELRRVLNKEVLSSSILGVKEYLKL